jgi:hypothetical protein
MGLSASRLYAQRDLIEWLNNEFTPGGLKVLELGARDFPPPITMILTLIRAALSLMDYFLFQNKHKVFSAIIEWGSAPV